MDTDGFFFRKMTHDYNKGKKQKISQFAVVDGNRTQIN